MIDREQSAVGFAGSDHAVGVGEVGGERFFAKDAFGPPFGRVDDEGGVGVVGGGDSDDVELLFFDHLAVVLVLDDLFVWKTRAELVEHILI